MSSIVERAGLTLLSDVIRFLTIIAATGSSPYEMLGMNPFGRVCFDYDQSAHKRYGIDVSRPAAVVLRPDGWVGTMIDLTAEQPAREIEQYFRRILVL